MATEEKKSFHFSVDSALLGELGEKLVSTVHVALTELVKNSYDADASLAEVRIESITGQSPRVIVTDDGIGMSLDEVRRYWMKIGTSNKLSQPISDKFGRQKTGSKGIGRFACRRLGLKLRLTTTAELNDKNRFQTTCIEFDWTDFKPGTDVEDVECKGETSIENSGKTGTRLEIWGAKRDEWQSRGFEFLQRQLAVLASNRPQRRPRFQEDPGFKVLLKAPGLGDSPVDLRDSVIDASWGTIVAAVGRDGRAELSLNARGLGGTKKFTSKRQFTHIKGATLRIGILPTQKEETRKPELLADYVLKSFVNEWGGIQVRFNGFRVFPYGDPGDDWLRIDADRGRRMGSPTSELLEFATKFDGLRPNRVLLNMLGMRNYVGQVDVSSETDELVLRIDRQGFVENEAFFELRDFARYAVEWASIHREQYIRLRETDEAQRAFEAVKRTLNLEGPQELVVPKATSFLKSEIRRIVKRLPPTQQHDTEVALVRTVRAIESASRESFRQLHHLRLVASASTLTLLFAHEVRTVIGTLGAASKRLEILATKQPANATDLAKISGQLNEAKRRFDNLVSMTGIVGAFRTSDTLFDVHLVTAIERTVNCFRLILENYAITVNYNAIPADVLVGPIVEGELYTVLLNVLSNSIKAVIASGRADKRIAFELRQDERDVTMTVSDNGVGLKKEFFEDVFTPFIADPGGELYDLLGKRANPDDAAMFGTGSGLGLSIARDVIRSRKGDIRFVDPPKGWGTSIEIVFP